MAIVLYGDRSKIVGERSLVKDCSPACAIELSVLRSASAGNF